MRRRHLFPALPIAAPLWARGETGIVRHPPPQSHIALDDWYPLQLLRAALQAADSPLRTQVAPDFKPQGRWVREMEQGTGSVDVAWFMADAQREAVLRPIRIPIFRGLFGWRLLIIRRDREDDWTAVRSLEALRRMTLLQGHDWPDTEVLRRNGLRVETAIRQEALAQMLMAGRADAFPRSALEAWVELPRLSNQLMVAPGLMLQYPAPMYFFVAKGQDALAATLERGLERLVLDGGLERLFQRFHGRDLRLTREPPRTVLRLQNPLLGSQTPLARKELWEPV